MSLGAAFVLIASVALLVRPGVWAQSGIPPASSQGAAPAHSGIPDIDHPLGPDHQNDPAMIQLRRRMAMMRNAERQKELVRDTQKLYDLASQLKADVAKTNQDTLSVDVIKKAGEIEKLAKSVKDKMKGN